MPDELRSPIRHHLVLHQRDPEQGVRRFYSLMIERDLFGTVRLVRNWGRIGTNGQELVEIYDNEIAAGEAVAMDICSARSLLGIRPVYLDRLHPHGTRWLGQSRADAGDLARDCGGAASHLGSGQDWLCAYSQRNGLLHRPRDLLLAVCPSDSGSALWLLLSLGPALVAGVSGSMSPPIVALRAGRRNLRRCLPVEPDGHPRSRRSKARHRP